MRATAYDNACLPSPEQLQELLKQRRTVRRFSKRKLHRRLIAEIAGYAAYAPTNNYHLRLVAIDDPALLETLYAVARKVTARLYNLYFRSDVVFSVLSTMTPKVDVKTRIKLARAVAEGEALEQPPAAMVFVVGDRRVLLSEASAQYALYNIILYALTNGIGSRINAAGQVVFDRNRKIRRQLGLERQEHVLGAVELGYPGVRFRNKVDGKALPLQWNGAMELQGKNTEAQQRLSSQKGVGSVMKHRVRSMGLAFLGLIIITSWWFISNNERASAHPEEGVIDVWVTWGDNPATLQAFFDRYDQPVRVRTGLKYDRAMKALAGSNPPDLMILSTREPVQWAYEGGLILPVDTLNAAEGIAMADFLSRAAGTVRRAGWSHYLYATGWQCRSSVLEQGPV